jgi:hypothetical protein
MKERFVGKSGSESSVFHDWVLLKNVSESLINRNLSFPVIFLGLFEKIFHEREDVENLNSS